MSALAVPFATVPFAKPHRGPHCVRTGHEDLQASFKALRGRLVIPEMRRGNPSIAFADDSKHESACKMF